MDERAFQRLISYLEKVPSIEKSISFGNKRQFWQLKLSIDIENRFAWNVVQQLGHVLNNLPAEERLPTIFYSFSPPTYMNGGPYDFLSWIIESKDKDFKPETLKQGLKGDS